MNIAAGSPGERGKYLEQMNPKEYINKLLSEEFNGYLCVTTHGERGIEEGIIFFHTGGIVSSNYEYYKFNKQFLAEDALQRSLNALLAKKGVVDLYSLSSYQVQLVLTLNEENNLKEKVTKKELKFPNSFSDKFEKELITESGEEVPREELLKKFGLTKSIAKDNTRNQLMKKAEAENDQVEETMKKAAPKKEKTEDDRFSSLSKLLKKK